MYIIHSVNKEEYEKEIKTGSYGIRDLEKSGFIHCSDLDTYYLVAPSFKNDYSDRLILLIDTEKVEKEIVKWESSHGVEFPHIYGFLNKDAVVEVYKHLWNEDRLWVPNEELNKYSKQGFKRKI